MSRKKKERVELRYYELPQGEEVLPLLGDRWKCNYGADVSCMHFHNLWEVGYCHEGSGQMELADGRLLPYRDGTFTLIPPNTAHNTRSATTQRLDYWEFLFCHMDKLVEGLFPGNPVAAGQLLRQLEAQPLVLHRQDYPALGSLLPLMLEELRQSRPLRRELTRCHAGAMALEFCRAAQPTQQCAPQLPHRLGQIKPALDYLEQQYAQPLRIAQLARQCGMSETHFRRLFEDAMGATPVAYLNQLRIRRACQLLAGSDRTVEAVALEVGYLSQSTFNRNFSRLVGMAPCRWRRTNQPDRVNSLSYTIEPREGWR